MHVIVRPGTDVERLKDFQDELLNVLPKSIDILKECVKKAVKSGFGYNNFNSKVPYCAMAQTMLKIHLVHKVMPNTLGPFEDDMLDVDTMVDNMNDQETWLLQKLKQNALDEWEEVLDYIFTLDTDDDLQYFRGLTVVCEK